MSGNESSAHHPSGVGGLGETGPIRTISAATLPEGKFSAALQMEYIDFNRFSDSEMKAFASRGNHVHSADSILHYIYSVSYGLTDDLTFSLRIPYIQPNNIREAHSEEPDEIHARGDAKGFGDITFAGQYRFINKKDSGIASALLFGIKTPSGNTNDRDKNGERFEAEFQAGSGSWDPFLGMAFTKRFDSFSVDSNLLYTFATKGTQDTDLGDVLNYNAALSYRALKRSFLLDLIIEVNGEWKQKEMIKSENDDDSGGNTVFLSPGVRLSINKFMAYISAGFPVIQNLNGNQNDIVSRILFGVGLGF
jgi:hypothetical protein